MAEQPRPENEPRRRAPQYGELAPEGWEWKPPVDGTAASTSQPPNDGTRPGSSPVPGVPHNLGAGDSAPASAPATDSRREETGPSPYRAEQPQAAPAPPAEGRRPRVADRVITIVLLVIGAFGTLNSAASFFALDSQLRLTASMIGIESPEVAGWVKTLGLVSGLAVLLLYAVTVIFSIQRMRAGKLAFWVPLTAGAIAVLLALIIPMIAMGGAPEIMQQLESDPTGSLDRMMQYLQEGQ